MTLRTEYNFTLPKGYVGEDGTLHKQGVMRLATARDEIQPQRDPRVQENEAYLTVIMLSRVVTELGELDRITPKVIEGLFAADMAYLQDFYSIINFGDPLVLESSSDQPGQESSRSPFDPAGVGA
jgi:hypothetical protein